MGRLTHIPRRVTGRVVRPGGLIAHGDPGGGTPDRLGPELVTATSGSWERGGDGSTVQTYNTGAMIEAGKRYQFGGLTTQPVGANATWRVGTNGAPWEPEAPFTGSQFLNQGTGQAQRETHQRTAALSGPLQILGNTNGAGGSASGVSCREIVGQEPAPPPGSLAMHVGAATGNASSSSIGYWSTGAWADQGSMQPSSVDGVEIQGFFATASGLDLRFVDAIDAASVDCSIFGSTYNLARQSETQFIATDAGVYALMQAAYNTDISVWFFVR